MAEQYEHTQDDIQSVLGAEHGPFLLFLIWQIELRGRNGADATNFMVDQFQEMIQARHDGRERVGGV